MGAGVFGVTAAIEMVRRGHAVRLLDPGPLPHPDASSTDVSKMVRMDYGADVFWTEMAEVSRSRWREWNEQHADKLLYHADGLLCLTREPMRAGGFEYESFRLLTERGWALERLDRPAIQARFPAWNAGRYSDGYLNPFDGWVPSGQVVEHLVGEAGSAGVELLAGRRVVGLLQRNGRVAGVTTDDGGSHEAETVVVAAGAWTPTLLPWLDRLVTVVGQPVLHFQVDDPEPFTPPQFTTWALDIATTGWYGFAALPDGTIKVGNHGPGRPVRADEPRVVFPEEEARCRAFLRESLPALADAPVVERRLCLYTDSWDNAFLIDHDPAHPGLVVATGGSGHGFKFAPLLGGIIADVVEGHPNRWADRFRWREPGTTTVESSRHHV